MDTLKIEILEDGTLKIEADKVSAPNHVGAESFLREVQKLAGGAVKITHKHKHQAHSHSHGQDAHQH